MKAVLTITEGETGVDVNWEMPAGTNEETWPVIKAVLDALDDMPDVIDRSDEPTEPFDPSLN